MITYNDSTSSEVSKQVEIAAELLGNLFKFPLAWKKYKTLLLPDHFSEFGFVFQAMLDSERRYGELNFRSVAKDIGSEHLQGLVNIRDASISEGRTDHLVEQLKKFKTRKDIIQIADKLKSSVTEFDPTDLINKLKNHLDELIVQDYPSNLDPERDYEDFIQSMIQMKNNPTEHMGLLTGLQDLDFITKGWQRSDFIVIAGRTSMGKSAFALQNVLALAKDFKCLYFSLEMSKKQVYARLVSSHYDIQLNSLRSGAISDEAIKKLEQRDSLFKNIMIDDTRAVTADYIAEKMMEVKHSHGLDFVVVDYLQDIKEVGETNDNTGSALARICRKLRKAAHECDVALMGMSQVSREVEKRNDKRPNNSDLSGSTGIETSADVIGILYRDEYYNPDTKEPNVIDLIITKHRNGALGLVKMQYEKSIQRIRSYQRASDEHTRYVKKATRKKEDYE
ncbi:DnaB Replicative DNA helicase [uncultured Caudovirales phage]|uniref:DnaB Replicative DNA helicase n=1 Tax=uncultured Caudovirales phage TaxID=2100421 RepID=A0A6J7WLP0_9CAUD|nr:DnaB Replicative DNA helicase [uncultured Caudovirales phage]CAB5216968.1 DnaB Replicative DNA helicase [uncultured Caudovirales phage]